MTNRTPAPEETQARPPDCKSGPVTDATRHYWLNTVLGWADQRLPGPQYDECYTALHQGPPELAAERDRLRAALVAFADPDLWVTNIYGDEIFRGNQATILTTPWDFARAALAAPPASTPSAGPGRNALPGQDESEARFPVGLEVEIISGPHAGSVGRISAIEGETYWLAHRPETFTAGQLKEF